jgi:predicted pyridoxine 5'-phosphate oxidase superfamily flavin-nucleotide-binding protein
MAQTQILANQGPNSINGGGTPIVPLDPPPSDDPNGSGGTTTPTPTPTPTQSANDTVVMAGSTASITDTSGNAWTITSSAQVAVNGTTDTSTAGVIELAFVNSTIWQENGNHLWWGKSQPNASWSPAAGTAASPLPGTGTPTPTPTPTPTQSANDTVVMAGSTAAITDASLSRWTINNNGQVAVNGTADTSTAGVIELAYVNGTVWQENGNHLWWGKSQPNASWAPAPGTATSPLPGSGTPTPTPTPTGTTFDDEFNSLSLHRNWQAGDNWQLIAPDSTDGRGGSAWNESGSQWWVNPSPIPSFCLTNR